MANTGNTQQIIDYGATANDGTGDPLRTAFIKTEENFSNIWLAGPVGSNITIANNTIQTNNTNGNLILKPNGTGVVQSNASVFPNASDVRDLGSASRRWRKLYLGSDGLDSTGPVTAASIDVTGDVTIQGNLTVEGDTIQIGNITTDTLTIQLANTATTDAAADGAGITVGANDDIATLLYDSGNNVWTTNIGVQVSGPITGTSIAVSDATVYGNIDAINGNFTGNVTANYFIGDGSLLTGISASTGNYVFANNLMSVSNEPMEIAAIGAGSDIDIEAADAVFIEALASEVDIRSAAETFITTNSGGNVWTFDIDGTLSAPGNITTTGNITANYFLGNIQSTEGNIFGLDSFNFTVENISARTANNGVNIGAGGYNNLLVLPTDVLIQNVPLTVAGNIIANETNGLYITANLPVGGTARIWNFDTNGDLTVPNYIRFAGNTIIGDEPGAGTPYFRIDTPLGYPATITTDADISGNNWSWTFGADGNLVLPSNKNIIVDGGDGVIGPVSDDLVISWDNEELILRSVAGSVEVQADNSFQIDTNYNSSYKRWIFDANGYLVHTSGDTQVYSELGSLTLQGGAVGLGSGNVSIVAVETGVAVQNWIFDNTGNLTAPGNIITTGNVSGDVGLFNDINLNNAGTNRMLYVDGDRNIYDTDFSYDAANGAISGSGNITAGYFIGDGSLLTGLPASYSDANVATFLAAYGSNTISTTGNITAGNFVGSGSNVELVAQSEQWVFDTTGNLTLPSAGYLVVTTGIIGSGASPAPSLTGFSSIATTGSPGNISASGNLLASGYANITGNINGSGATFSGNVTAGNFIGNGSQLTAVNAVTVDVTNTNGLATTYYPTFVENRTTAQIARADADLSYRTDTNTLTVGNISSAGNITAAYFIGNGSALTGVTVNTVGNITGTSSNVDIIAGSYQWTFNNTGNLVLPGNTFAVNYANGTAVALGGGGGSGTVTNVQGDGTVSGITLTGNVSTTGNLTLGGALDLSSYSGNISSGNLSVTGNVSGNVNGFAIGYRDIPVVGLSANTTISTSDAGKQYYSTSASALTLTIANNASQAFQTGATINIVNQGAGNVSVLRGVGVTMYLAGNSTSSDRTLTSYGVASVTKVATDTWFITGVGLI